MEPSIKKKKLERLQLTISVIIKMYYNESKRFDSPIFYDSVISNKKEGKQLVAGLVTNSFLAG